VTLCVYALSVPGLGRIAATGITGERLRLVPVGGIVAIVGEMSRTPRPTEDHLRKYDRVVQALSRRTPALLPARYGTHVRDLYELALILGARQDALRRRLKAVRNRVQMTVRIPTSDRDVGRALLGSPGRPDKVRRRGTKKSGHSGEGGDYLRSRARDAAAARDIPQFEPLRAAVRRWVRAERVEQRGGIATVYHLVPRGSVEAYRRALDEEAREAGVRLMVSGPWPAYAFADGW